VIINDLQIHSGGELSKEVILVEGRHIHPNGDGKHSRASYACAAPLFAQGTNVRERDRQGWLRRNERQDNAAMETSGLMSSTAKITKEINLSRNMINKLQAIMMKLKR
jgi:hypothetical protein